MRAPACAPGHNSQAQDGGAACVEVVPVQRQGFQSLGLLLARRDGALQVQGFARYAGLHPGTNMMAQLPLPAEATGRVRVGQTLLAINGAPVQPDAAADDVMRALDTTPAPTVYLTLRDPLAAAQGDAQVAGAVAVTAVRSLRGRVTQLARQLQEVDHQLAAIPAAAFAAPASLPWRTEAARRGPADRNIAGTLLQRALGLIRHRPAAPPAFLYSRLRPLKLLHGHMAQPVYSAMFDRTGERVVTGADDKLVKVWSARTGNLLHTLRGHNGHITDLSIRCDGAHGGSSAARMF